MTSRFQYPVVYTRIFRISDIACPIFGIG
jgi:hypothetical protein